MKLTEDIFKSLEEGGQITYVGDEVECEGDEFTFDSKSVIEFRVNRKYSPLRYSSKHDYPVIELHIQEDENFKVSLLIRWDDHSNKIVICGHGSPIQPLSVYETALNSNQLIIRKPSKIPNPA